MAAVAGAAAPQVAAQVRVHPATPAVGETAVAAVERHVQNAMPRLQRRFSAVGPSAVEIVVHRDARSLPAEARTDRRGETAGVALLGRNRIHLILDAVRLRPPHDLATVVEHELAHVMLDHHAAAAGPFVPRWWHEGIAQWLSGAAYLGLSEQQIAFRSIAGGLLRFSDLERRFPRGGSALQVAYAQSLSFVGYLARRYGFDALLRVTRACGRDADIHAAFGEVVGDRLLFAERDWREYLRTGSGAGFRWLLESCFSLMLVAALPLLVLAARRRWRRDARAARRLATDPEPDAEVLPSRPESDTGPMGPPAAP